MRELSAGQAMAMARERALSGAPHERVVFLDVREPWEVKTAAIASDDATVVFMPMGEVTERFGQLDPLQPVVCICHHGARSAQVVAFLQRRGFAAAYNLAGGIDAWSDEVDPGVTRY